MLRKTALLIFLISSCKHDPVHLENYKKFEGNWTIVDLYSNSLNLKEEGYYVIGFEKHNHMWFMKSVLQKESEFIGCTYEFYKHNDSLRIKIYKCEDDRLNADFKLNVDTLSYKNDQYLVELSFENKTNHMSLLRYLNNQIKK